MVASSLLGLSSLDDPLAKGQQISIVVPGDDTLVGFYYPDNGDQGFLLLEGFGSDQTALRPMTQDLTRHRGFMSPHYQVFTFDFSGHGRSPGGLDFDNASTDRMALQVLAAETKFRELSGLSSDKIYWIGHSLGARVALQASTMTETPPAGLLLIGAQINLVTNKQSEFFTGVQDSNIDWINELGPQNPKTDIILFSGTWDDILTPKAGNLLANKLTGSSPNNQQSSYIFQQNPLRFLIIEETLFKNFQLFDYNVGII